MIQLPIGDRHKCPENAQVRGLVIGKLCRNVETSLGALVEFCKCASVSKGVELNRVIRSGKFSRWLGSSGAHIPKPVKCTIGVFVASNDSVSSNLLRISLLAEALGLSSQCFLLYEEDTQLKAKNVKKALFRMNDDEAAAMNPSALVLGLSRISVASWNDCLEKYLCYIKTSMPSGESIASRINLDAQYEKYDALMCVRKLRSIVTASGLDQYSVYIEYDSVNVPGNGSNAIGEVAVGNVDGVMDDLAGNAAEVTVVSFRRYRHFIPDISVW